MSIRALARWHTIKLRRRIEIARGAEHFFGIPETWYETPRWRCRNGHVVGHYIKSEERGDLCPRCMGPVRMTHPTDVEAKAERRARGTAFPPRGPRP